MNKRFSEVLSGFSLLCRVDSLTCRQGSLKSVGGLYEVCRRLIDDSAVFTEVNKRAICSV